MRNHVSGDGDGDEETTKTSPLLASWLQAAALFPLSPPSRSLAVSSWLRYLVALGREERTMDVCCFECVTGARLGRHSRFLGRVAVAFGFFTSDGRNDGGDGVLGPLVDGSGITRHQQPVHP